MREIKCRAKVKWNGNHFFAGDWVEGYYAYKELTDEHVILVERANMNRPGSYFAEVEVIPETVGQYTGLKDKNGDEICQGDIVVAWSVGHRAVGEVKNRIDGLWIMYPAYQKGKMWGLCPNPKGETSVEIIGNVHENPELLEVK